MNSLAVIPRSATLGSLDSKRSELLEENELLKEIPGTCRVGGSLSGNLGVMGMPYQGVIYEGWLLFFLRISWISLRADFYGVLWDLDKNCR